MSQRTAKAILPTAFPYTTLCQPSPTRIRIVALCQDFFCLVPNKTPESSTFAMPSGIITPIMVRQPDSSLFIGTGVGSGIVINGQIYYGDSFCAGEIGHATLDPEGPECNCGSKGCLEAYVNGPAIVRRALTIAERYKKEGRQSRLHEFGHELNARHIALAFDENDEVAQKTVHEVARYLGIGLANYINILNPGAIVLGGGVMQGFYNHMINDVKKVIEEHCLTQLINTPISQAKYMDYGAVLGAACLFRDDEKQGIEF